MKRTTLHELELALTVLRECSVVVAQLHAHGRFHAELRVRADIDRKTARIVRSEHQLAVIDLTDDCRITRLVLLVIRNINLRRVLRRAAM